ncbi:hypothetical protein [Fibrobacter sp.]|uniref:hypothetical protein n=1 Tax=Fibrobacter sp. TaxID=35828 RepID=UPI00388DDF67
MAEKKDVFFEQFENCSNCFVNAKAKKLLQKDDALVCHYMSCARLENWIKNSIMTFVSPYKWSDPFEKIYLSTVLKNLPSQKKYTPPRIACLCFTKSQYKDSVAFWRIFKPDELTQLVRVEFYFKELLIQLIKLLKKNNLKIYVIGVDYSLTQEKIKDKSEFIKHILDHHNVNKIDAESLYIEMFSYKRKAFAYENEIRMILVPLEKKSIQFDENGCFVAKGFNYKSIVKKMWLEPVRLPSGWTSVGLLKEHLEGFENKIGQSILYKEQKKCEFIDWRI